MLTNRLRHEALLRFMPVNESTTIPVEVPIWLPPSEILELKREHSILLRSPDAEFPDQRLLWRSAKRSSADGGANVAGYDSRRVIKKQGPPEIRI